MVKKMQPQPQEHDLFSRPNLGLARKKDPDTSKAAARSLDPSSLEFKVLTVIKSFGHQGCISDDVVREMPMWGVQTITPRYRRLMEKGYIIDTGERRQGAAGRAQRVMRAVQ